jgi:hypothetical protein
MLSGETIKARVQVASQAELTASTLTQDVGGAGQKFGSFFALTTNALMNPSQVLEIIETVSATCGATAAHNILCFAGTIILALFVTFCHFSSGNPSVGAGQGPAR